MASDELNFNKKKLIRVVNAFIVDLKKIFELYLSFKFITLHRKCQDFLIQQISVKIKRKKSRELKTAIKVAYNKLKS